MSKNGSSNSSNQGTQGQGKAVGLHELEEKTFDPNEQKVIDKVMENFDKGVPDAENIKLLREAIEIGDVNKSVKKNKEESDKTNAAPLQLSDEEYKNFVSALKSVYQAKQKNPNVGQKLIKSLTRGSLSNSIKTLDLRRFQKNAQKEVRELEYAIQSGASSSKIAKEAGDVIKFLKSGQGSKKLRQLMGGSVKRAKKVPQKGNKNTIGFP